MGVLINDSCPVSKEGSLTPSPVFFRGEKGEKEKLGWGEELRGISRKKTLL